MVSLHAFSFLRKPMKLIVFAAIMSAVNLVFHNIPFFSFVREHTNGGAFSNFFLIASLVIVMLALNMFACYLLVYLLRYVGRVLIAIFHILSSACVYYILKFHIIMDDSMMSNVFNTRYSEASGFITWSAFGFLFLTGIIPAIYVLTQKIDYGKLKMFGIVSGSSIGLSLLLILLNLNQVLWIGKYDTELGGLIMPYSYVVNTIRLQNQKKQKSAEEIKLPDASISNEQKEVVVLVIGESARKHNFQLYGYERPTNPLLSQRNDITVLTANSNDTYTTAGVKAILEYKGTSDLYEILPNYLYRTGVDVAWRTDNWGEPPVHIQDYKTDNQLAKIFPDKDRRYDEFLTSGLRQRIDTCSKNKLFIVLHTSTSHGPCYSTKYPKAFEKFSPVCHNVENAKDSLPELVNAYDNSILYTDYLLNNIIDTLQTITERKCAMIYVSDHGESLGENNMFMHGIPLKLAPKEQYEIPFIVWTSDGYREMKKMDKTVDQHYIYHSVLNLLSVESPIYNADYDLFLPQAKE